MKYKKNVILLFALFSLTIEMFAGKHKICLGNMRFDCEQWRYIFASNPQVSYLQTSDPNLFSLVCSGYITIPQSLTTLKVSCNFDYSTLIRFSDLQRVSFSNSNISDGDLYNMSHCRLTSLSFKRCANITDEGVKLLLNLSKWNCPRLQRLNLIRTSISACSFESLVQISQLRALCVDAALLNDRSKLHLLHNMNLEYLCLDAHNCAFNITEDKLRNRPCRLKCLDLLNCRISRDQFDLLKRSSASLEILTDSPSHPSPSLTMSHIGVAFDALRAFVPDRRLTFGDISPVLMSIRAIF